MKTTEIFKRTIKSHLDKKAADDPFFAATYAKENKNLDECINYILTTVQDSGCSGFDDKEIYSMAIHYYDEDDIKVTKGSMQKVVVNHKVELTKEEITDAKKKAKDKVMMEEEARLKRGRIKKRTHDTREEIKETKIDFTDETKE